jgi:hypothetical protein
MYYFSRVYLLQLLSLMLFGVGSVHAQPIEVSLKKEVYKPVHVLLPTQIGFSNLLTLIAPPSLKKVPLFKSKRPLYGQIDLKAGSFPFILDHEFPRKMYFYWDKNRNWDLTDDGDPVVVDAKEDSNGLLSFSFEDSLPWKVLDSESPWDEPFRFKFSVSSMDWARKRLVHQSLTHLKGSVDFFYFVEGRLRPDKHTVDVTVMDAEAQDGFLLNDGVVLDINSNKRIDKHEKPGIFQLYRGVLYRFKLSWPKIDIKNEQKKPLVPTKDTKVREKQEKTQDESKVP